MSIHEGYARPVGMLPHDGRAVGAGGVSRAFYDMIGDSCHDIVVWDDVGMRAAGLRAMVVSWM
ncbi:hypothetical protein F1645_10475 [Novacetimonas hansenii]|uniref:Uncharacterized protein n=2 Tax=Novacetimonas hansenii TaxID=436 RepID=A0ABQ0SFN7_NOVHA|nr:hypothetical protein [Novacetimonas hansenii]EFG83351.1 hypothetical protein GXY_13803 [Novacetimonas hansenii ATCC 23769]GAN85196.1 hypothetical protein Gaha_0337_004 [Novacetimonas hansenii JCM 7643]GBQ54397.1 hypothetical protein AA0243_0613 [Novacetimonas hansenii NRIC 0243]GEC64093.1 hypothetical protein GHA01_19420 [Novacetimonas hansenii]